MTAEPPESPVTEGVRSLEVRWIFPGQLEAAVAAWFGRFPAGTESREDTYLLDPQFGGLSVKVRGGGALEVKVYRGSRESSRWRAAPAAGWSPGRSGLSPRPAQPRQRRPGRLEAGNQEAAHQRVPTGQRADGGARPGGGEPRCAVELTEVRARGEAWWTVGFEATGPTDLLRRELEATAALVFAQDLPGGVELGPDSSRSYAEWLGQRPGYRA